MLDSMIKPIEFTVIMHLKLTHLLYLLHELSK